MKKVYPVFVIAWAYLHASLAAICDTETIQYRLGVTTTLININAEDIFHLPGACNKQINIVGAVNSVIYVAEVGLSKTQFYKYEGNLIQTKFYYDRIFLRNRGCSKNTRSDAYWREITDKGLMIHINDTSSVCLRFVPNKRNLNLGGHRPGTSIRLFVNVEAAECDAIDGHTANSRGDGQHLSSDCKDICTAAGFLKRCTTPVPQSPSPTVLVHTATRPTHPDLSTPLTSPSTYPTRPSSQQHITSTSELVTFSSTTDGTRYIDTGTTPIAAPITSDQTSLHTLRPSTAPKTTTNVPLSSVEMTTRLKHAATVTLTDTLSYNSPSTSGMNTRIPGKNSGVILASTAMAITSTNIGAHPSESATDAIPTTTSDPGSTLNTTKSAIGAEGQESEKLFGLVEGLYVVAGCTLGILVIVFLGCCLHHRHKMCINQGTYTDYNTTTTSKSDTPAGHADVPWRDNWLVRHHGNNASSIGNGYSSQSDGELSPIHGKFFNQSNQELHLIHTDNQFVYPDVPNRQDELLEYEDDENPYDNPWPEYLVKLSKGDIVLARRGIERSSSINTHTTESSEGRRRFRTESMASADTCMCRNVKERCNMSPTCGRFHYRKRDTRQGPLAVRTKRYHVHRHESTVSLQHEPNIDYPRRKRTVSEPTQAVSTATASSQTANPDNRDTIQNDGNVPNIKERSETTQTVDEAQSKDNITDEMQQSTSKVGKEPTNSKEVVEPKSPIPKENKENHMPTDGEVIQKSPTLRPNVAEKDQHQRAKYAFVSKLQGAVGTMQFKK